MGPLPEYRTGPARVFDSVAVDLFDPLEFQGTVNKRQTSKGWGVIFVCSASSAVHIEFTDSFSTNGFLLALRRFMCAHGKPSRIQSDRGEQLVAASKQIQKWDYAAISEWTGSRGIEGIWCLPEANTSMVKRRGRSD